MRLRKTEISVLVLALFLIVLPGYVLLRGIDLVPLFLGETQSMLKQRLGEVRVAEGEVKRKGVDEAGFLAAAFGDPVFIEDSIATGPASGAVLVLDDGSRIDVLPSSLIRLVFKNEFSLSGIRRAPSILVESGDVDVKAGSRAITISRTGAAAKDAAPAPASIKMALTPRSSVFEPKKETIALEREQSEPQAKTDAESSALAAGTTQITLMSPADQAIIKATPSGSSAQAEVAFEVALNPASSKGTLQLLRQDQEVVKQELPISESGKTRTRILLKQPGDYTWRVISGTTASEYRRLTVASPTLGKLSIGKALLNQVTVPPVLPPTLSAAKANIQFSYNPPASPKGNVTIVIQYTPAGGATKTYEVPGAAKTASWTLPAIEDAKMSWKAVLKAAGGVRIESDSESLDWSVPAPELTFPAMNQDITAALDTSPNKRVLFTWKRMPICPKFEVLIAQKGKLNSPTIRQTVTENFFSMASPGSGLFDWRVDCLYSPRTRKGSGVRGFELQ